MQNPFHYGDPVTGPAFAGRREEIQLLATRIRDHLNVVVISPRRYGKTSLLLAAQEHLSHQRPKPAIVATNVFLCKDAAVLAGRLVSALYGVPGARWHRTRQGIVEFLKRIRIGPGIELDDDGKPRFSFGPALAPAATDQVISDVFEVLAEEASDRPVALVLDEFQGITRHGEHLPFLLKALSDRFPTVSLVVAGSQRHLMDRLMTDEGAPLFGIAQRLALGSLPDEEMLTFLVDRSFAFGKPMERATAQVIVALAGPVPNDIQHLAYEAFEVAGGVVTRDDVGRGMDLAIAHESNLFADRVQRLSDGQTKVLIALSGESQEKIFSSAFARSLGLAGSQSVKKAIDAMAQDETVVFRNGRWVVGDPFLASWLRRAAR